MTASLAVPAVLAVVAAAPATASATSTYCSPTGDYCYAAKRHGGVMHLTLDTFSLRGRIEVCVRTPANRGDCRRFRLRSRGHGLYGFDVRWSRHFPNDGPGRYRVHLRYGGSSLRPPISFRIG